MNCSVYFLVILGAIALSSAEKYYLRSGMAELIFDDFDYLLNNPGLNLTEMVAWGDRYKMKYAVGNRVYGDRILDTISDSMDFASPHNAKATVGYRVYPGVRSVLTYVYIEVEQTSYKGDVHVVQGGIRQRHIAILIRAFQTSHFSYFVNFYGL